MVKYIFGVIGVAIMLIVAVVLLSSTGGQSSDSIEGDKKVVMANYADSDAVLSYTQQGRLTGPETHKEIRIIVSRTERKIELLSGYDQSVEKSQSYANSQESFNRFIYALEEAGYSRKKSTSQPDYRGVCPLGNRYIYTLNSFGEDLLFLWSSSCSGDDGTFGGRDSLVRKLYQNQIPDYREFTRGVKL